MALLSVNEALERVLLATQTLEKKTINLRDIGIHQVLAQDIFAKRTQPPFRSSAMDGYAFRLNALSSIHYPLKIVGEAAAGQRFKGQIGLNEAVRIFTGAPVPDDADCVVIQENVTIEDNDQIVLTKPPQWNANIRPEGGDFKTGECILKAGSVISPSALALCAASGHAQIDVISCPRIAVLATGNELVLPDKQPSEDQIISSNSFGLMQLIRAHHCDVIDLGIAKDDEKSIQSAIARAQQEKADLLVTSGGVSVGEYDLVQKVLKEQGLELNFWKVAMRPGKPLMFGHIDGAYKMLALGLPGNPVSCLLTAHIFLIPILEKLSGRHYQAKTTSGILTNNLPKNGARKNFVRAKMKISDDGQYMVTPLLNQDSSNLSILTKANCLIIQEEHSDAIRMGESCSIFIPQGNLGF
ncbi:gephyrin-like molybdotransferase Glp [Bartonella tamiae]|uniref:Molybdopterin molybdenumtransferase n=1 Tax=Bartonella tamiae Th239 TaxID=1094558 RepID=J0ZQ18_9HYPH|nr:gephyrin-like molybdotransferase Glp [Bartonella tamiae]EJF90708.1 molybdenum cofactor synthesis domain-containing protein [Bartonella tamiae Th239]EJF93915.1 molybdenum cofactor synthesis domain-containing protein [Bartonella tamiae Th307]